MNSHHIYYPGNRPEPAAPPKIAAPTPKLGDRYTLEDGAVTAIVAESDGVYFLFGSDLRWTFQPRLDGTHTLRSRPARGWTSTFHIARPAR